MDLSDTLDLFTRGAESIHSSSSILDEAILGVEVGAGGGVLKREA